MAQNSSIQHRLEEDEQLCFIHVPKTAGTTFRSILDAKFDSREICPAKIWSELEDLVGREDLGQYRLLRGHFYYNIYKLLPQKPTYITMLRDPIERVISGYEFMKRFRPSRTEELTTHEKALTLSLKEYVCDPTISSVINAQTRHFTQYLYQEIGDFVDRRWLEDAKKHLQEFAFIGLTEQFQESMALLSYTFGWNPLAQYQNLMVAPTRLRQADLSQDVVEAIAERNQLDIELYQYAKEIFATRQAQMLQELREQHPEVQVGAVTPQVLHGWLEKHYEQRYLETNPKSLLSLTFRFDQSLSGSGWHLREATVEGSTFRWTGPGTQSTLDFPIATDRDMIVEFRIINAVAPDILKSLTLSVDGQAIGLLNVDLLSFYDDQETPVSHGIFQGIIPKKVAPDGKPFSRLMFQVNRTTSPQSVDLKNPDTRPVGLAFDLLQIFPAASGSRVSAVCDLFNCSSWIDTVNYVKQHLQDEEKLLAPAVFVLEFYQQMNGQSLTISGKTSNYRSMFTEKDVQWVIAHKGMKDEINSILPRLIQHRFKPVFANEVFVVFSTQSRLKSVSYASYHVKPLYVDYLKDSISKIKSLLLPSALPKNRSK